jgi:hypothetical protein
MRPELVSAMTGDDVMSRNFEATRLHFHARITMKLQGVGNAERIRRVNVVYKIADNGIDSKIVTQFDFPPDMRRTSFLQIQHHDGTDDMWVYLSSLDKTRRLVSNNKRDSYFGTEFSYGDVLIPFVSEFRHKLLRTDVKDGQECYVVESIPREEAVRMQYGYSKKITWILASHFNDVMVEIYGEDGRLLKREEAFDYAVIQESPRRWMARKRVMTHVESGRQTILILNDITTSKSMSDDFFSAQALGRLP